MFCVKGFSRARARTLSLFAQIFARARARAGSLSRFFFRSTPTKQKKCDKLQINFAVKKIIYTKRKKKIATNKSSQFRINTSHVARAASVTCKSDGNVAFGNFSRFFLLKMIIFFLIINYLILLSQYSTEKNLI